VTTGKGVLFIGVHEEDEIVYVASMTSKGVFLDNFRRSISIDKYF